MITLTSGVPGAGKTLWTMCTVEERREKENRPVYYSGINDCALEWIKLEEGETWEAAPDGAIVVVDECQRLYPVRKQGSPVPDVVRAMETHRHRGIDLYLIAQNPLQVDTAVRHLVGEYRFLDRPHGHAYAVIWRFGHVCDWRSTLERQSAEKTRWRFPKASFGWYKSAEAHTHKRTWPRALLILPVLLVVVGIASWYGVKAVSRASVEVKKKSDLTSATLAPQDFKGSGYMSPVEWSATRAKYLEERRPRIREAPESAPVYDALTAPVAFPRVASCAMSKSQGCRCFTQQATPVPVADSFCFAFVQHGAFDPYLPAQGGAVGDTAQGEGGRGGARGVVPGGKIPELKNAGALVGGPPSAKPGVVASK